MQAQAGTASSCRRADGPAPRAAAKHSRNAPAPLHHHPSAAPLSQAPSGSPRPRTPGPSAPPTLCVGVFSPPVRRSTEHVCGPRGVDTRGYTTPHSVPLSSPDPLSFRSPPFAFVFQPPSLSVLTPTPRLALEQPPTQEASFLQGAALHAQRRFPMCGQHRMGTAAWLSSYRSLRRHCIHRTRRGVRSPPAVRRLAQVAPN
jgi:hypothetical protein